MMRLLRSIARRLQPLRRLIVLNVGNLFFALHHRKRGPLISVIIPVHNRAAYLPACLESVRRQSYRNLECIVVDDASDDASRAIADGFARLDRRFHVLAHATNRGPSEARNTGLADAHGDCIAFLDADDFLLRHSIRWRVRALEAGDADDLAGVFSAIVQVPERGGRARLALAAMRPAPVRTVDFISQRGECPFPIDAALVKADIVRKMSGFRPELRQAEDCDLWQRMLRHGYRFVSTGQVGGVYRRVHASLVQRGAAEHVAQSVRIIRWAYEPMMEREIAVKGPFLFREPVQYYQRVLSETTRLIHYAMMLKLIGDEQGFSGVVAQLAPGSWFFVSRHIDVDAVLQEATNRFYCLKGPERGSRESIDAKRAVYKAISARIGAGR